MWKNPNLNRDVVAHARKMTAARLLKTSSVEVDPFAEKQARWTARYRTNAYRNALACAKTEEEREYVERVDMLNRSPLARYFGIYDDFGQWTV